MKSTLLIFLLLSQVCIAKPPNILFIVVDDLRPMLGCYGDKQVKSPNIDRLAANGIVFERAHVQQAICSASRASFLTGCRPQSTGVNFPYTPWFNEVFRKQYLTLPKLMDSQGYYTRTLGKIHHGPADEGLSEAHYAHDKAGFCTAANLAAYNASKKKNTKAVKPWEHADLADEVYEDGKIAEQTIQTLRRAAKSHKPFFIAAGFLKPHLPFVCPKKYYDLYDPKTIQLSKNPSLGSHQEPISIALKSGVRKWWKFNKGIDEKNARQLIHSYMACVSFVDAQVGKVLNQLDELGLRDETIVFFLSDHGWHLGDHGHWGKATNFELGTRTPLIISLPEMKGKKLSTNALVELVDLYPTIAELAQIPRASYLEGNSLRPLLEDPSRKWKSAVFSQYPRGKNKEGFSVRDEAWRYTEWRTRSENEVFFKELYHNSIDPQESKNLAGDPAYSDQLAKMQLKLKQGWKQALPKGVMNSSSLEAGDDSWYKRK